MEYLQLFGGLIILILGGEFLVRGAVSMALKLKIAPLVIGMTVVSFGTSAPELLVSLEGVLSNHPDVSVGAVVGSNISNLGLVLGITVLIFPVVVNKDSIRIDWPLMIIATVLFYFFIQDSQIVFWEGLLYVAMLTAFTIWLVSRSRKQGKALAAEQDVVSEEPSASYWKDLAYLILSFLGLYFGAEWLIDGVVVIANEFGVSEKLISISVVAFGTSLPELVTSAVAAFRKETDISMGNLIGSNVFNLMAILGITAMVKPLEISSTINSFDVYFLLGISLLVYPMMRLGKSIGTWKGILLILFYVVYIYLSIVQEF